MLSEVSTFLGRRSRNASRNLAEHNSVYEALAVEQSERTTASFIHIVYMPCGLSVPA